MPLRKRYKLLLDEGLSPCQSFPKLNRLHDLKHLVSDYGLGGASDSQVCKLAENDSRMIVVFNIKHFLPLAKNKVIPSIISLSPNLKNKDIDLKIIKLLKKLTPHKTKGFLFRLSKEGVEEECII